MPREKRGPRKVALTSPQILVPAVVGLALVAILLVAGLAGGRPTLPRPSETRSYDAFSQAVREFEVEGVQMYRDTLYVTPRGGPPYLVQDVSPDYTITLLTKYKVPLQGIAQPSAATPMLGAGVLVAVMLPYLLLGWLTVMMVRAASGAANVDPDAYTEEVRCPECSRPVSQNARFCQHCAHPVQWTGQVRQCPACGQQVWRSDRHCRSCGKNLPAPPPETKRTALSGESPAVPPAGPRPPAQRPEAQAGQGPKAGAPAPGARADDPDRTVRMPTGLPQSTESPRPAAGPARRDRPGRPPTPGPLPGERKP